MAFLDEETAWSTATVRTKNAKPPNVTNVTVINIVASEWLLHP